MKWEPWEYHKDVIEALSLFPDIILFKARQLGWTWLVSGWGDWNVVTNPVAKGLYLSQGQLEAYAMIAKSRYVHRNLPDFLRLKEKHSDNRGLMDFVSTDSLIEALPSTEKAGRSADSSFVIRDELAQHPEGASCFTAISPAIDSGGQIVDLSTIDKMSMDNHFTERVNRALMGATRKDLPSGLSLFYGGESKAVLLFGGWKLRPVRQEGLSLEEWFELRVKPKYTALQIEQEYPENIDEALKAPKTRLVFDSKALDDCYVYKKEVEVSEIDTHGGMVKVWVLPVVGERYVVFSDPSAGKDDPHAIGVLHTRTGQIVATSHGKVTADVCAKIHDSLVRFYNNAYNSYEYNSSAGGTFVGAIEQLDTPNRQGFRKGVPASKDKGWWTGGPTRKDMIWGLEEAIRKRLIIFYNKDMLAEMEQLILPEGEEPQVRRGAHDDYIMMLGGLWQIKKYAPLGIKKVHSFNVKQEW